MANNRTQNSIRIISSGLFQKLVSSVFRFLQRTAFIYVLGVSYLGLSETFANILSLLAISELGLGTAVTFHLYRPIADEQQDVILSFLSFFKRCYRYIGIAIFVIGLALMPFLHYLVKMESSTDINLTQVYLLSLITTCQPYLLFAYKNVLPTADQRQYAVTNFYTLNQIVINVVDIVVLLLFKSYMLSLFIRILLEIAGGFVLSGRIDKLYPFIKQRNVVPLDKAQVKNLFINVRDIFIFRTSSVIFQSTDNLVIAGVLGARFVGYYANYLLITYAVGSTVNMLIYSFHAGIGNVVARESKEKQLKILAEIDMINRWLTIFCTICFAQLLVPFVTVWMSGTGDPGYILPQSLVLVICANYFFDSYLRTLYMFRETNGLFRYGRYRVAVAGAVNVVLSVILAKYMGMMGVFLATLLANISICTFYYPKIVFEIGYGMRCGFYRLRMVVDFLMTVGIYAVVRFCCRLLPGGGLFNVVLQGAVCAVVINLLLLVRYWRLEEFNSLKLRGLGILKKLKSGGDSV